MLKTEELAFVEELSAGQRVLEDFRGEREREMVNSKSEEEQERVVWGGR